MAYYTTFGEVQRELTDHYRTTGEKLQFSEAVDELYRKGLLTTAPGQLFRSGPPSPELGPEEFSRLVDTFSVPVRPHAGVREYVSEDDMIPQLRDVFVIRHPRCTRTFLHRHNYVELDFVMEGKCTLHFEGERIPLAAGELCVVAPCSSHDLEVPDAATAYSVMLRRSVFESSFYSLLLRNNALAMFFRTTLEEKNRPNYLLFRVSDLPPVRNLLHAALLECHLADGYSNTCCVCLINLLLAYVLRESGNRPPKGRSGDLSRVLEYIQQNYQDLTLSGLARQFHYSEPYLCTLIKQSTGVSYTELVKSIRMTKAVEYLRTTDQAIGRIAELVGYHSADHFSRVFRSAYGISPLEYRRRNRQQEERLIPFETT